MTDIPLRDQLAEIVSSVCEKRFGPGCSFRDDTALSVVPELAVKARNAERDALTEALLEHFDIQLRSPHPLPDANEET